MRSMVPRFEENNLMKMVHSGVGGAYIGRSAHWGVHRRGMLLSGHTADRLSHPVAPGLSQASQVSDEQEVFSI